MALPVMKTPAEYIDYYFTKLKSNFANDNIKLSKTGFVGFLLNVLGNTQFDNKQYYDGLFSESFPALSQDDKNLQFHSALHGYTIAFAKAAQITTGKFNLDLSVLPTPRVGLLTRTITFGSQVASGGSTIAMDINGLIYTSDAQYKMIAKIVGDVIISYYAEIISPLSQINSGVQISTPSIPIINTYQYDTQTYSETVPFYPFGSHYTISIPIPSGMIYELAASLILPNGTPITLITDTNKNTHTSQSNVLFYTLLPNKTISIELGSGLIGAYVVEGSTISIAVKTTNGFLGNISPPGVIGIKLHDSSINTVIGTLTDTYSSGAVSTTIDLNSFLLPSIDSAIAGTDILSGTALRDALIRHIQTRDSLVSQTDYNNILAQIFQYYAISFNKSKLANNTISLYIPLMDKYNNIYPSTTSNFLQTEFESQMFVDAANGIRTIFEPELIGANSNTFVSPFLYKYDKLYNTYLGNIIEQDNVYNYTSILSTDSSAVATSAGEPPHIFLTLIYYHNTISPYSILKISSYEDVSKYISGGTATIRFVNQNVEYDTTTTHYISNISKHSGIQNVLAVSLTAAQTNTISLTSTAFFPIIGSIIIGTEEMTYTGKNDNTNTLTGVTRATRGILAAHSAGADVFDITINNSNIQFIYGRITSQLISPMTTLSTSLNILDSSLFPPFGTVIIGSEQITYTSITGSTLNGLTRGINLTTVSTHAVNDIAWEYGTSNAPNVGEILGFLETDTQLIVTLNDVDIAAGTGFNHVYNFSINQSLDIQDYLQVKQYNIIGVSNSLSAIMAIIDTIATVTSTSGFLTTGSIVIGNEEMSYTGLTATTFTGVTRAINATVASQHEIGEIIKQITSNDLEVPILDKLKYTSDRQYILSSILNNYQSIALPANRSISDEMQLKFLNTSYIELPYLQQTVTNGSAYVSSGAVGAQINAPNGLIFPLRVNVSLLLNSAIITSMAANVSSDIDTLMITIAQELTNNYTGTQIRISDATIVTIAKQIAYVDDANVAFADSAASPTSIVNNEINVLPEATILSTMTKINRINYIPTLWHWDVNNIAISYTVE